MTHKEANTIVEAMEKLDKVVSTLRFLDSGKDDYLDEITDLEEVQEVVTQAVSSLQEIKSILEDCPQPTAQNGHAGHGVQEWINHAYALVLDLLEGK